MDFTLGTSILYTVGERDLSRGTTDGQGTSHYVGPVSFAVERIKATTYIFVVLFAFISLNRLPEWAILGFPIKNR